MKHLLPAVQRTALRIPWAAVGGCAAALLLTAAAPGGQYAPWALAAVAAAGVGWQGLLAVVCAGLGALLFMDFQPGLRHTAAALLIFCANTALCNTRLYRRPRFRPIAAVCAAGLTQLPYLIQRGGRQWALCMAALALLYGAAALLPDLPPVRWRGWYWTCAARESCIWRWCCAPPHPLPQGCGADKECRRLRPSAPRVCWRPCCWGRSALWRCCASC